MKKIKHITVQVTYRVGLGELEVPDEIYLQLDNMCDEGNEIDGCSLSSTKYNDALEWLRDNITESDAFDWSYEIEDLE